MADGAGERKRAALLECKPGLFVMELKACFTALPAAEWSPTRAVILASELAVGASNREVVDENLEDDLVPVVDVLLSLLFVPMLPTPLVPDELVIPDILDRRVPIEETPDWALVAELILLPPVPAIELMRLLVLVPVAEEVPLL